MERPFVAEATESGSWRDRPAYLSTHRAVAAFTRQYDTLIDAVVDGVQALPQADDDKPKIRRSPGRCIIQLGPVALTMAWLRSTLDSVDGGQLMVVVWNGTVPIRGDHQFERVPSKAAVRAATVSWEDSLVPEAESDASWAWRFEKTDSKPLSSEALASALVERLRAAHVEDAGAR